MPGNSILTTSIHLQHTVQDLLFSPSTFGKYQQISESKAYINMLSLLLLQFVYTVKLINNNSLTKNDTKQVVKLHKLPETQLYLPNTEPACFGAMSCGLTRMPLLWKPQHATASAIQTRAPRYVLVYDIITRKNAVPNIVIV